MIKYFEREISMKSILLITAFFLLITIPASADIITVTLDGVLVDECGETWIEAGVVLSFVTTTPEDCDGGGNCYFGVEPDRVWLYPARLNLELSGLAGKVTKVEVDIIDYCGVGCTRAFLYDGASTVDSVQNSIIGDPETMTLSSGGVMVDRAAVSSCEGTVIEIRLTLEPVGTGDINGNVREVTGKPLRALVIAINAETKEKDRTVTNTDGYYKISDLAPGIYWVLCIKRGYEAGIKKAEVVAGKETTVDFTLIPKME